MSTNDISMNYGKNYVTLQVQSKTIPFRNFRYRVSTNAEEIHLPSKWNAGWHDLPSQFNASMALFCIKLADGSTVPKLIHDAQLRRQNIQIVLLRKPVVGIDAAADGQLGIKTVTLSLGRIMEASLEGVEGRAMPMLNVTANFNRFSLETEDATLTV